jgi:hypothetical protein
MGHNGRGDGDRVCCVDEDISLDLLARLVSDIITSKPTVMEFSRVALAAFRLAGLSTKKQDSSMCVAAKYQ